MNDSFSEVSAIGSEIESVKRFEGFSITKITLSFANVFTQQELDYCYSKQYPAQHLAARFAGKEAILNIFNRIGIDILAYNDVQILNNTSGRPAVTIQKEGFNDLYVELSLSHTQDLAISFVVVCRHFRKELKTPDQPSS